MKGARNTSNPTWLQAVGPVALVSLLLNDGLVRVLPGSDINDNPNQPADPALQEAYNHAAVQARAPGPLCVGRFLAPACYVRTVGGDPHPLKLCFWVIPESTVIRVAFGKLDYIILYYVMLCYVMLCYVMLCYIILYY